MVAIGCCIPGGSFMPEGEESIPLSAYDRLRRGAQLIHSIGYDCTEVTAGLVNALSEKETEDLAEEIHAENWRVDFCNSFIPSQYPIISDRKGTAELYAYAENTIRRLSRLGVKILVFGSGKARSIPLDANRATGEKQIDDFLRFCDPILEKYALTLVIEPLNRRETNWVRNLCEGAEKVRQLGLSHIRLLADGFHMACEEESVDVLEKNKDILLHAHLAAAPDRVWPGKHGGIYESGFLHTLKKINYSGCVTVECGFTDFTSEAASALSFIRRTWNEKQES